MEKAKSTILNWKKNIAKFDAESYGKGFANGDFWVVQGYPDNIYRELSQEDRENVDFIVPPNEVANQGGEFHEPCAFLRVSVVDGCAGCDGFDGYA